MGKCVKSDAVPPQMLDSALLHLSPSADGAAKASLDKHGLQPRCDDDDDRESVCDHHEEDISILICCMIVTLDKHGLQQGRGGDDNVTLIMGMFL